MSARLAVLTHSSGRPGGPGQMLDELMDIITQLTTDTTPGLKGEPVFCQGPLKHRDGKKKKTLIKESIDMGS